MPSFHRDGVDLYFEQHGARADIPLLLIHGLTCQIIHWPPQFIDRLAASGLRVIAMDNRDMGLSSKLDAPSLDLAAILDDPTQCQPAYSLQSMAADAIGLLNHLGQAGAHVVGLSMGGMIAQQMAIDYPDRIYSLTSIMSSTSNPDLPPGSADAMAAFISLPDTLGEPGADREAAIKHHRNGWSVIGGKHYDSTKVGLARLAEAAYDRGYSEDGFKRQLLAIRSAADRTTDLGALKIPTLVIHGAADPLVPLAAGEATANAIPNAQLAVIEQMGHDLSDPLLGRHRGSNHRARR